MKMKKTFPILYPILVLILFPCLLYLYTLLDCLCLPSAKQVLSELSLPLAGAILISALGLGYGICRRLPGAPSGKHRAFLLFPACFCIFLALLLNWTVLSYRHYGPLWCGDAFSLQDTTHSITCLREMSYDTGNFATESHYFSLIRLTEVEGSESRQRLESRIVQNEQSSALSRVTLNEADVAILKCSDLPEAICSVAFQPHYRNEAAKADLCVLLCYGNETELPIHTGVMSLSSKQASDCMVPFCTTGNRETLYLCIMGDNLDYTDIFFNQTIPLRMNYVRTLLLSLLFFVVFCFYRKESLEQGGSASPLQILETDSLMKIPLFLVSLWGILPELMIVFCFFKHLYTGSSWYYDNYTQIMDQFGQLCLGFAVIYLCIRLFNHSRRERIAPYYWMLAALLVWVCVCTAASGHFFELTAGTRFRHEGLTSYFYYAGAFICCVSLRGEGQRMKFLSLFGLAGTFMGLLILAQDWCASPSDPVLRIYTSVRAGTFYNTNHCGYYLTMTIACLFGLYLYETSQRKRFFYLLSMEIQFFALITNDTFGSFLGVILSVPVIYLLYFLSGRRYHYRILLPAALLLLVSAAQYQIVLRNFNVLGQDVQKVADDPNSMEAAATGSGRFVLWKYAFEKTLKRPILGYGPDGLSYDMPDYITQARPHNEYLQYGAFFGLPGLILYLGALVSLAVRRFRQLTALNVSTLVAAGALVGYLISAFVGNTMFYSAPFFFMLFGLICADAPASLSSVQNRPAAEAV